MTSVESQVQKRLCAPVGKSFVQNAEGNAGIFIQRCRGDKPVNIYRITQHFGLPITGKCPGIKPDGRIGFPYQTFDAGRKRTFFFQQR